MICLTIVEIFKEMARHLWVKTASKPVTYFAFFTFKKKKKNYLDGIFQAEEATDLAHHISIIQGKESS